MLRLSRATGIWPERDVIKYIRSAIAIDGLIGRFAPGFDVGRYLERVCARHLQLQGFQAAFSQDQLLEWSVASARLARDGALRGGAFVDRLLRGEVPVRAEIAGRRRGAAASSRTRAVGASAAVAGLTLLLLATPAPGELGLNLFTAEAVLVMAGALLLGRTAWRLA
jgi:hypothetical protein